MNSKIRDRLWVRYLVVAAILIAAGVFLFNHGNNIELREQELASARAMHENVNASMYDGRYAEARTELDALLAQTEAHADDPAWKDIRIAAQEQTCLLPYAKAEKLYLEYQQAYLTSSAEHLPNPDEVLAAYTAFADACSTLIGKEGFTDPDVAWRLEYNVATGIVWQMIVRQAMLDAKLADLKPLYDKSLAHYKKAMVLAEKAERREGDPSNPVRYVAQTIDFMTRSPQLLDKNQEQKQQQQQEQGQGQGGKGLGDFLSGAENPGEGQGKEGLGSMLDRPADKQAQGKFFPSPLKSLGAGTGRMKGGVK